MTVRLAMIVVGMVALLALMAGPALAGKAPVAGVPGSDPDGATPHTHHVSTEAGCVDIDAVEFFANTESGLHTGANESGNGTGPWHGSC